MTRAALIILVALLLVGCAPTPPETVVAQNANPVVNAQAQAANLAAITEFMDAAAARERAAAQPDLSGLWALLFVAFIVTGAVVTGLVLYYVLRAQRLEREAQAQITNNFYIVPVTVTPRGRIIPLDNGSHQLESGQNVTDIIQAIKQWEVTK